MHMFMRPATQYVLRCLVKGNTFFLWGAQISYSLLCVRATFPYGIPFMMHDKSYNSPLPLQHSASNPSCSKVMAVTTGIIIHFSFCAAASVFLSMPTWNLSLWYIHSVQTELFSWWWCWNECSLLDLFTNHTCVHTFVPTCRSYLLLLVNISPLKGCMGGRLLTGPGLLR